MDVVEIKAGELRVTDAAAVEQLHDGFVARGPACRIFFYGVDHAVHLLDGGHARKMLGQARSGDKRGDILLDAAGARQPLEPTANSGERPRGRGF